MRRLTSTLLVLATLALVAAGDAAAGWQQAGTGPANTRATNLAAGDQPTVSVSGRNATVNWTASSVVGGPAAASYTVKRYNGSGVAQTIGGNCSGSITATSCTEQGVPPGGWRYSVTPKYSNWTGAEGALSANATVGQPSLSLSPTTVTTPPEQVSGQIQNFVAGQTVSFRLDDPSSGPTLSGSITPSPVPGNGTADVSVTIPDSAADGAHTVYAIGNQGDQASAAITVARPVTINTAAWDLRDASSGTAANASAATAYDDDRVFPTDAGFTAANFNNAFAANRYYQWDYNSPLRPGVATSGVKFDFRFRSSAAAAVACFYFEVISGGNVIATHGSTTPGAANSTWCTNGTEKLVSTPLPAVTSTDIANGLRIKVYGYESGKKPIYVDEATVSGTAGGLDFTLYETSGVNAADTSPQTLPWSLASEDAAFFTNASNWATTFNTARYLQVTFPASVPSSATIDSVSFEHRYQAGSGSTICYYLEAWSGASPPPGTAIGTYPSPPGTNGVSCASGTASWVRDSVPLPNVDTPAKVNGLVLRLYYRTSSGGATKSREDYAGLKVKYH